MGCVVTLEWRWCTNWEEGWDFGEIVEGGGWSEGLPMKFLGNLVGNAFLGTKTKLDVAKSWILAIICK